MKKKILIVTSTRAEYGIISGILKELKKFDNIDFKLLVTGTHLLKTFGHTIKEIKGDQNVNIWPMRVLPEILRDDDISKYFSKYILQSSRFIKEFKPDLVFVVGDRYEVLAVCTSSLLNNIPIAHLHGGETTSGAFDNQIRNAISKLSHFHFVIHHEYKKKLISMGERKNQIFNFGSPAVNNIKRIKLLKKEEVKKIAKLNVLGNYFVVTIHPETLDNKFEKNLNEIFFALENIVLKFKIIFTLPNADPKNNIVIKKILNFTKKYKNSKCFSSLGYKKYFSLVKFSLGVIGNSSSGVIEVPALSVPTINIGKRQDGRIISRSVINCKPKKNEILRALNKILSKSFNKKIKMKNLFYKKNTNINIAKKLTELKLYIKEG